LVDYPNPVVKLAVAQNSQISDANKMQLFEELFITNEKRIIQQLASNQNTPVSILEKIGEWESPQNKFCLKLRRLLTRDTKEDNPESEADVCMDDARKILAEYQVDVDVEEWMTLIESYQWMTLLENYNYVGDLQGRYRNDVEFRDMVNEQWQELLPNLPTPELQKVINNILQIPDFLVEVVKDDRNISVALVGNPNTPIALREELQKRLTKRPGERYRSNDDDMRMALAYNTSISEAERTGYFQSLIAGKNYLNTNIASNPLTPLYILEQLLEGGVQEGIAKNPTIPESFLRKIADLPQPHDSILRTIAENKNAPADLLIKFVRHPHEHQTHSNVSMYDLVIGNPSFPIVECYRLILEKEEAEEIAKAHQLMARRSDSPYALAQVLEKGDRNAKITAARSPKTPIHVLEQLAKNADESIRSVVLENSNLPLSSRLELTQDISVNVRGGLASHRRNRTVPNQVLEVLVKDKSSRVRAQVALNPNTPIEILKQLASDSDPEVCEALTRNQNTPAEILEHLGVEKGIVNIYNAKTPSTALEKAVEKALQANVYERDKILDNLLRAVQTSQMPASVLAKLAKYKTSWVRSSVAAHPNTPISALEPLLNDDYGPVLWSIARRADAPPHYLERLLRNQQQGSQDYEQIIMAISNRREIPANLLDMLMDSNSQQVYRQVATQANLPPEILERLLATSDEDILTTLAYNQSLSSEFLARLAEYPNPNVCGAIVKHANMTQQLWEQLARSKDASVRQVVATNSNTPVNILESLASDLDNNVRAKIASNANSPIGILEELAKDEDAFVRTATASNPNLTEAILIQLATDEKVEVRRAVAANPNTLPSVRETLSDLIITQPRQQQTISPTLRYLSRLYNPNTDDLPTLLGEYSRSQNDFVRFIVLMNPQTPLEILSQGIRSASWLERYAVAENPAVTEEIKQYLVRDSNRIVRAAALANR
jgi:hypothetical protein